MFEIRFRYRFEAAHRFTKSCADSCATPHGHTWYATLHFESHQPLKEDDMIEEFGSLKSPWRSFITQTVDHSFMHHAQDPILGALRDFIPGLRGLPFPGDPTTELIAELFYQKATHLYAPLLKQGALRISAVTIEETPTNHVVFRPDRPVATNPSTSWWGNGELTSRTYTEAS